MTIVYTIHLEERREGLNKTALPIKEYIQIHKNKAELNWIT